MYTIKKFLFNYIYYLNCRCKFNYKFLNIVLEELMPWYKETYDFSLLEVNRYTSYVYNESYYAIDCQFLGQLTMFLDFLERL